MTIGTYSNIYLIIFLPLICSLFSYIFSSPKINKFITILTCLSLGFLIIKLVPDILIYEKISNDFGIGLLSIGLEFRMDLLSLLFLGILTFLSFLTVIFYDSSTKYCLSDDEQNKFYRIFLLKIFGANGLILSNSLFNIYLFIEIYSFSFFTLACLVKNKKYATKNFHNFCLSAASSLLILLSFLAIFLAFEEHSFEKIIDSFSLLPKDKTWFLLAIFMFLFFAIIAKFFPLWQNIESDEPKSSKDIFYPSKPSVLDEAKNAILSSSNLEKSDQFLNNLLTLDRMFIGTLLGFFLIIKFIFFLFGAELLFIKNDFAVPCLACGFALVVFASSKLYRQNDLRNICNFLAISTFGFCLGALGMNSNEAIESFLFFLLNFSFAGLFFFFLSFVGISSFQDSSINFFTKLINLNPFIAFMIKFMMIFIAAFPLSLQFFGYWHMASAAMIKNIGAIMIIALMVSSLSQMRLATKLFCSLRESNILRKSSEAYKISKPSKISSEINELALQKPNFLQIFALIILSVTTMLITLLSNKLHGFFMKLSSYLVANTF